MKAHKAAVVEPAYVFNATLDRTVDGDTVYLEVDLGFRIIGHFEFRLLGINAPEMKDATLAAGKASRAALDGMLKGVPLRVQSQKGDKYGRWLGTIWFQAADGSWQNANDLMVKNGFAVPFMVDG